MADHIDFILSAPRGPPRYPTLSTSLSFFPIFFSLLQLSINISASPCQLDNFCSFLPLRILFFHSEPFVCEGRGVAPASCFQTPFVKMQLIPREVREPIGASIEFRQRSLAWSAMHARSSILYELDWPRVLEETLHIKRCIE
jgi:hypothetical protein